MLDNYSLCSSVVECESDFIVLIVESKGRINKTKIKKLSKDGVIIWDKTFDGVGYSEILKINNNSFIIFGFINKNKNDYEVVITNINSDGKKTMESGTSR